MPSSSAFFNTRRRHLQGSLCSIRRRGRCGHFKNLALTYEKVATTFKMEEHMIFANLDADKYKDLAGKYNISGFPTRKVFPKDNKAGEDSEGGWDLEDFVSFINEKCGTSRDAKGQHISKTGIVEPLDILVKEFVSTSDEEKNVYAVLRRNLRS